MSVRFSLDSDNGKTNHWEPYEENQENISSNLDEEHADDASISKLISRMSDISYPFHRSGSLGSLDEENILNFRRPRSSASSAKFASDPEDDSSVSTAASFRSMASLSNPSHTNGSHNHNPFRHLKVQAKRFDSMLKSQTNELSSVEPIISTLSAEDDDLESELLDLGRSEDLLRKELEMFQSKVGDHDPFPSIADTATHNSQELPHASDAMLSPSETSQTPLVGLSNRCDTPGMAPWSVVKEDNRLERNADASNLNHEENDDEMRQGVVDGDHTMSSRTPLRSKLDETVKEESTPWLVSTIRSDDPESGEYSFDKAETVNPNKKRWKRPLQRTHSHREEPQEISEQRTEETWNLEKNTAPSADDTASLTKASSSTSTLSPTNYSQAAKNSAQPQSNNGASQFRTQLLADRRYQRLSDAAINLSEGRIRNTSSPMSGVAVQHRRLSQRRRPWDHTLLISENCSFSPDSDGRRESKDSASSASISSSTPLNDNAPQSSQIDRIGARLSRRPSYEGIRRPVFEENRHEKSSSHLRYQQLTSPRSNESQSRYSKVFIRKNTDRSVECGTPTNSKSQTCPSTVKRSNRSSANKKDGIQDGDHDNAGYANHEFYTQQTDRSTKQSLDLQFAGAVHHQKCNGTYSQNTARQKETKDYDAASPLDSLPEEQISTLDPHGHTLGSTAPPSHVPALSHPDASPNMLGREKKKEPNNSPPPTPSIIYHAQAKFPPRHNLPSLLSPSSPSSAEGDTPAATSDKSTTRSTPFPFEDALKKQGTYTAQHASPVHASGRQTGRFNFSPVQSALQYGDDLQTSVTKGGVRVAAGVASDQHTSQHADQGDEEETQIEFFEVVAMNNDSNPSDPAMPRSSLDSQRTDQIEIYDHAGGLNAIVGNAWYLSPSSDGLPSATSESAYQLGPFDFEKTSEADADNYAASTNPAVLDEAQVASPMKPGEDEANKSTDAVAIQYDHSCPIQSPGFFSTHDESISSDCTVFGLTHEKKLWSRTGCCLIMVLLVIGSLSIIVPAGVVLSKKAGRNSATAAFESSSSGVGVLISSSPSFRVSDSSPSLSPTEGSRSSEETAPESFSSTSTATFSPTISPTLAEVSRDTVAPTNILTYSPTTNPTQRPSTRPTHFPTTSPTIVPTTTPTGIPTRTPTGFPTTRPIIVPTTTPTAMPTSTPTGFPTTSPTISPTTTPTAMPTTSPTIPPTVSPTISPTANPTPTPDPRNILLLEKLIRVSPDNGAALLRDNSPQARAFEWLIKNKDIHLYGEDRQVSRFALAVLYFATDGDNWIRKDNWLSDEYECTWYQSGETSMCEGGGREIQKVISRLKLASNNLNGPLPPELSLLRSITSIDLRFNKISGSLPEALRRLRTLRELMLSHNSLAGTIPEGMLIDESPLITLDVSFNRLRGKIPSSIRFTSKLKRLVLDENQFTHLPKEIRHLTELKWLSIDNNNLDELTNSVEKLTALEYLSVKNNSILQSLPKHLDQLPNLRTLDLGFNKFYGDIPSSWHGNLGNGNIEVIRLNSNDLRGEIPNFSTLGSLVELRLDGNDFDGSIGSWSCPAAASSAFLKVYADCNSIACPCCAYCCRDELCSCQPVDGEPSWCASN